MMLTALRDVFSGVNERLMKGILMDVEENMLFDLKSIILEKVFPVLFFQTSL